MATQMTVTEAAIAVLSGGRENIRVGKHDFNLKALELNRWEKDVYVIKGTISHRRKLLRDDQFKYTIKTTLYPPNTDMTEDIDFHGFSEIVASVIGGAPFPFPANLFSAWVYKNLLDGLEQSIIGKGWQDVASTIVVAVYISLIEGIKSSAPPPPIGYVPPISHPNKDHVPGHCWCGKTHGNIKPM